VETALPKGVDATALRWTFEEAWRNLLLQAGGCHRIRTTPIPFPYTVHLRRALVGYAMTVPFAFANEFGWRAVPATFIVTYILFGIEELGVATENPFGNDPSDLPLESYCAAVDASLFDPVLASLATTDLGDSA
jgi:putative membrane protein